MALSNSDIKDVIILGGGLAGLTLAYQLKRSQPELNILVVEKNKFPIPEKTAKVGESTVEIGSHYLKHTLGLDEHFDQRHLRKHGLRCFFGTPQGDFSDYDELGVSELFGLPTYQIDRGAIENYLHRLVIENGVEIIDDATSSELLVTESKKSVVVSNEKGEQRYRCRWLVDAAGRQALLKNTLSIAKDTTHKGNALWFRVDKQIKLDEWTANSEWQNRTVEPNTRWLSTNHLMGPGYWVWVIPLDNGATSIGIVMDEQAFSMHDFSSYDSTYLWLKVNHPQCAEAIKGAKLLDYVVVKDYSLGCKKLFSDQRWAITGEAGVFTDPFYSPGTDFIAINNTFITDLIRKDFIGEDIRFNSRLFQSIYQSFFDSTMSLYEGQYGGFGDRRMMSLKLVWDYAYYWGVLSLLFFRSAITDVVLMRELNPVLQSAQKSNTEVQKLFRARAEQRLVLPAKGEFMNQFPIPCLQHFNEVLTRCERNIETASTKQLLSDNVEVLKQLTFCIEDMLKDDASMEITTEERALLGNYRKHVLA